MDNLKLIFLKHEKILLGNKSSEWIRVDLPAETWYWEIKDDIVKYVKRIKDKNNKITWRISTGRGEWLKLSSSQSENPEKNIWKKYLYHIRKNKLKRILND